MLVCVHCRRGRCEKKTRKRAKWYNFVQDAEGARPRPNSLSCAMRKPRSTVMAGSRLAPRGS